ncbi:hypothetical protein RUM43_004637 [Polyplax serrata]|uniref:Uncharacterized protein n=1 Tax=Polyplax serrata TaxID=468196 RepID=A0AAN8SCB9_POLSC
MKYFAVVVLAAVAVACVAAEEKVAVEKPVPKPLPAEVKPTKFTTKYDDISLDEILKSDRLLTNYFDCLMDTKPCTPDGTELKKAIPLALKEDCAGCSEKQKAGAETVIHFLSKNKPDLWKSLEEKYDPEGIYRKKHADFAAKKGIKV